MEVHPLQYHFPTDPALLASTPFYYYDMDVLRATLQEIKRNIEGFPFTVHYAVKANGNKKIISEIAKQGLGADLVSGGEISAALEAGFDPAQMTYSGVGKNDWEIRLGLSNGIGFFNIESTAEMEVVDQIADEMDMTARIAIRVNPDIDAHTHKNITTGTARDKFGISIDDLDQAVNLALSLPHIQLCGLHFHIGSQITNMGPYIMLCDTVNRLVNHYEKQGINFEIINVGGGLGIDYSSPDDHLVPDFQTYFNIFKQSLQLRPGQRLHFELGRAITAQCGTLISRVLYVKENRGHQFIILDAGMTDLIRPALYEAKHVIQNLRSTAGDEALYDVAGPVCESTDVFDRNCRLPITRRGDLLAIRSAGAYGESMASTYNMRRLPSSVTSDD